MRSCRPPRIRDDLMRTLVQAQCRFVLKEVIEASRCSSARRFCAEVFSNIDRIGPRIVAWLTRRCRGDMRNRHASGQGLADTGLRFSQAEEANKRRKRAFRGYAALADDPATLAHPGRQDRRAVMGRHILVGSADAGLVAAARPDTPPITAAGSRQGGGARCECGPLRVRPPRLPRECLREQLALQRHVVQRRRHRPGDADHGGTAQIFRDRVAESHAPGIVGRPSAQAMAVYGNAASVPVALAWSATSSSRPPRARGLGR